MSKFFKLFSVLALVGVIFGGLGLNDKVLASENIDLEDYNIQEVEDGIYYDEDNDTYFTGVYQVKNGVVTEKSVEQYAIEKAESKQAEIEENAVSEIPVRLPTNPNLQKGDVDTLAFGSNFVYSEKSKSKVYRPYARASIPVKCPTTSCNSLYAYSATETQSFTMTGNAAMLAVTAGASFTFTNSATVSSSANMNIPKGYQGWWEFAPYVNKTTGTLVEYNEVMVISSKTVTGYSPIKLGSFLDGNLLAVVKKL